MLFILSLLQMEKYLVLLPLMGMCILMRQQYLLSILFMNSHTFGSVSRTVLIYIWPFFPFSFFQVFIQILAFILRIRLLLEGVAEILVALSYIFLFFGLILMFSDEFFFPFFFLKVYSIPYFNIVFLFN